MAKILKKALVKTSGDKHSCCILEKPSINTKILLKTRDRNGQMRCASYSFIDKFTTNKGVMFIWNSYKSRSEQIRVSVMENGNLLLNLPENIVVDAAYY